jgi:tRNA G18 (ribose-2'-O)-methylase SpoU
MVLGNEVHGVDDEALEVVSESIEIPQWGTKHSFNVVVSVGIVLWHLRWTLNFSSNGN